MKQPPSSSSSVTQKSIYLWFRKFHGKVDAWERSTWYKLDLSQLNSNQSDLTLISAGNLHQASSAVAFESTIYVIGGNSRRQHDYQDRRILNWTREVYYLDTRCPGLGWKTGPTLVSPRTEVSSTVRGGKIYCFGGGFAAKRLRDEDDQVGGDVTYAEVLEPLSNDWKSITGPEHDAMIQVEMMRQSYRYGHERILDGAYELESNTWKPMGGRKRQRLENLDDINTSNVIRGLGGKHVSPRKHDRRGSQILVNIGDGRMCLIWESDLGLHCTKFRVSVHDDGKGVHALLATIEAFRVFANYEPRAGSSGHLKDCLVL